MTTDELIQHDHVWIELGFDFLIHLIFSKTKEDDDYSVDCLIKYDIEQKTWRFIFEENELFKEPGFENAKEKIKEFFEREMADYKSDWEEKSQQLLTSLHFAHEYKIEKKTQSPFGRQRIDIKEAKVGEEKINMGIYLNNQNEFETLRVMFLALGSHGKMTKDRTFLLTWDFAKTHLKGMKEFEAYLYQESKDRLLLLFPN